MSLIPQIRTYLETYYPQLVEKKGAAGEYYFEHQSSFKQYPSIVSVTIDQEVQTITLQVLLGNFFRSFETDSEKLDYVNRLNGDYQFVSCFQVQDALNLENHLLIQGDTIPPIIEYLFLLVTVANDVTGADEMVDFGLD